MATVTRTFCDVCEKEFTDSYWDAAPCHVTITMSTPAQKYENHDLPHVCRDCRMAIGQLVRPAKVSEAAPPAAAKGE